MSRLIITFKEPDGLYKMNSELETSDELRKKYFQFGELGSVELEVNEKLEITSARFLPVNPEDNELVEGGDA